MIKARPKQAGKKSPRAAKSPAASLAAQFRAAGDKAWNVYSVFVTEARASIEEHRQVRWIEEDLERTRKITATGVIAREDVVKALLPLLPIMAKPVLAPDVARDPRYIKANPETRSELSVPLIYKGKVIGVIQVSRKGATPHGAGPDFTSGDLGTILALCKPLGKMLHHLAGE